eukprot:TRINITY_DN7515_c0_g1_i1.p1 TRINITY_DN7515_c0_g1~~TRINITY_DN7515_c0_g1_i1.p1  ORF type:complete len:258 (-),score=31.53 TRINITY_DN7515_c0_g1_i1:18-770(-)
MESKTKVRLAILEADTLSREAGEQHTYTSVFTYLFQQASHPCLLSEFFTITTHDIVNDQSAYPSLDSVDAILITGSRCSAYQDDAWILKLVDFTQKAVSTEGKVKVIGICFGHQIVGRSLGAPVTVNDKGWELSVVEMKLSEKGKEVFGKDSLRIQQTHHDMVSSLPSGTLPIAETNACSVQGMLIPGKIFTLQGHPEFTGQIVSEILKKIREGGGIDEGEYKSGMARVLEEHDGVIVGQALLRFMRGQI